MGSKGLDIDKMIEMFVGIKDEVIGRERRDLFPKIAEGQVRELTAKAKEAFMLHPVLLPLRSPLKVCGDIHGQYYDLMRFFEVGGLPPASNYLFLGDYVDRGRMGLECIILLLLFKVRHMESFFLLRGNHENVPTNRIYGFYDECKRRFSVRAWKNFNECFNCMPLAATIDDKIFCTHGGLSPAMTSISQIQAIERPTDIPDAGLLCDLLWSDPDATVHSGWVENERGVSYSFGPNVVDEFLTANGFDLVCRAHQVVQDGYEFFADQKLVTVFSAPAYCGEFTNSAAMMSVTEEAGAVMCRFDVLMPEDRPDSWNGMPGTPQSGRGRRV